jgi:hypothetical protein
MRLLFSLFLALSVLSGMTGAKAGAGRYHVVFTGHSDATYGPCG